MELCDVFRALGPEPFGRLLRGISMGRLRTYQLFDRVKTRAYLNKLNGENLRKAAPRLWTRLEGGEEDCARDIAQAILVSHLEMIRDILDWLGIPNEDGLFAKDSDVAGMLPEDWQSKVWEQFHGKYPREALLFYINHLSWELGKPGEIFAPAD